MASYENDKTLEAGTNEHIQPVKTGESQDGAAADDVKKSWKRRLWDTLKTPGSALQIVVAAVIAVAIGMAVTASVDDIPEAAPAILEIPGSLWLRALRATGKGPITRRGWFLTVNASSASNHHRNDPRRSKPEGDVQRWRQARSMDAGILRSDDDILGHPLSDIGGRGVAKVDGPCG